MTVELLSPQKRYRQKHPERIRVARRKYYAHHREHLKGKCRISYYKYRDKRIAYNKAKAKRIREDVLTNYGGKCACCGEMNLEFLTIDHIKGGGTQERKKNGEGQNFYHWLIKSNYPKDLGLQVLCANCNMAKTRLGICPHKKSEVSHSVWDKEAKEDVSE